MLHMAGDAKNTNKKVKSLIVPFPFAFSTAPSLTAPLPPQPPGKSPFQTSVQALGKSEQGWPGQV